LYAEACEDEGGGKGSSGEKTDKRTDCRKKLGLRVLEIVSLGDKTVGAVLLREIKPVP